MTIATRFLFHKKRNEPDDNGSHGPNRRPTLLLMVS
jgi:hypothetical protein